MGETFVEPSPDVLWRILNELDEYDDPEHLDVSLTHESEWCLSVFPGGLIVWENVELDDDPRHLLGVERAKALALWHSLSVGDLATIESEDWRPGYR
ncbi:MAG: hypothetical protein GY701_25490 [Sulfitobacter sp.]|nr:hypothetical protein [Sulfitobacter sp.]